MSDEVPVVEEDLLADEVAVDIEIYDGPPDENVWQTNMEGDQDDDVALGGGLALVANVQEPRNWRETLAWYRANQTGQQIGFDPDGVCLKICRTARNLPARYGTAKQAQDATPSEHRVHRVRDLRRGMVLYFDDPNDSNRAGHVVTQIGRVADHNPDDLGDILVETNAVRQNEVVVVRADYFFRYWGDRFQFGATWLNGFELDFPHPKPVVVEPDVQTRVENFRDTAPKYDLAILRRAGKERPLVQHTYDMIIAAVRQLPDSPKLDRVVKFKKQVKDEEVLNMPLLNEAVEAGRVGKVKAIRDRIRGYLHDLPRE